MLLFQSVNVAMQQIIKENDMFDQLNEQFEKSFAPVNELVNINTKALEQLTQQQAELFTSNLNEGVALAKDLSAQKDLTAVIEAQKAYAESVQEKLTSAAQDAYAVISNAQEQAGEVLKGAFGQAQEAVKAAAPKAAPKAKAAKAEKAAK
jgi:phasin family protein